MDRLSEAVALVLRRLRPAWQVTTPAGRAALFVAVVAWMAGVQLGWQELFLVAACCRSSRCWSRSASSFAASLDLVVELDPARVVVGGAAGGLVATNGSAPAGCPRSG